MRLISLAKYMVVIISILGMTSCIDDEQPVYNPVHNQTGGGNGDNPENPDDEEEEDVDIDLSKWELAWEENFDGTDRESLKEKWDIEDNNGSNSILSTRRPENVELSGEGTLKLVAKHEEDAGKQYSAGSIFTKETFKYGYFECRYRYAEVEGTNNSFWMFTSPVTFEIDINEGKYPNIVGMNIHDHVSNPKRSDGASWTYNPQVKSAYSYSFDMAAPIKTKKIRFSTEKKEHFHMREFRIYKNNTAGYPEELETNVVEKEAELGLNNLAKTAKITVSGYYKGFEKSEANLCDDDIKTRFVSQKEGDKYIELVWSEEQEIGNVQFLNGYIKEDGTYDNLVDNYKLEYWDGQKWAVFSSMDARDNMADDNLGQYHIYGLEWNEEELIYYFDHKIIRKVENKWCNGPASLWLSLAIIKWGGAVVPEDIDGKFMEVDYVRVYKQ